VYDELRRLAASYLRKERPGHTLQATALVHEAYLRLVGQHTPWQSRAHFFGIAAQLMRRILLDHARAHHADKRGGHQAKVPLEDALRLAHTDCSRLLELDLALSRLAEKDQRLARVFELRFFTGLTVDEAAEVLHVAPRTINRDSRMAQAWLRRELAGGE
jgi:RNA polymerase sigma-70 factor (ECF subfamily)